MTTTEALDLLKQAATMIQCDYAVRVKLIEAVQVIEAALPKKQD